MKKATDAVKAAALTALLAAMPALGVKNVAVVETELDAQSGASVEMTAAEVRLMTAGLRREAVKNLSREEYNIMTSETVYAQGGAVLESCVDENCVITLGSKIGADYIVRGIVSKLRSRFALSVEMYETENGNLVASSDLVSSENIGELVVKGAEACAEMYRTFAKVRNNALTPALSATPHSAYTLTVNADPDSGGFVYREPDRETYAANELVTIVVMPWSGYKFTGWTGAATGKKTQVTVKMDGNKTLTANFYKEPEADAGGTGSWDEQFVNTSEVNPTTSKKKYHGGIKKIKTSGYYFAPKYIIPTGEPISWGGINYEMGQIFSNGMFLGGDMTYGHDFGARAGMYGGGISLGGVYDFGNKLQLACGGTVGFWYIGRMFPNYSYEEKTFEHFTRHYNKEESWSGVTYNIFAPFVKLRWDFVELTYRGLLGYKNERNYDDRDPYRYGLTEDKGFGWNHHQLMAGLYLSTLKREDMKFNSYFAPKYSVLLGPSNWTGVDFEGGLVFDNGVFLGIDFSLSPPLVHDTTEWSMIGCGASLGYIYDMWNKTQIAYGGTAGFWLVTHNNWLISDGFTFGDKHDEHSFNFLAPFVKLRWDFVELTYRTFLGFREVRHYEEPYWTEHGWSGGDDRWESKGFGLNHHQLMLGLYLTPTKKKR
jgi:uncharacterized repeat protein (TIGR02543 family)